MKKLATVIAVAALIGTPAFAADMAVKAPPPPPAPVYSWTGWYVGLNAGGGWGNNEFDLGEAPAGICGFGPSICSPIFSALNAAIPSQLDTHPSGFIGGGQIGYNYQLASDWVAGLEADFQGADIKGDASATADNCVVLARIQLGKKCNFLTSRQRQSP